MHGYGLVCLHMHVHIRRVALALCAHMTFYLCVSLCARAYTFLLVLKGVKSHWLAYRLDPHTASDENLGSALTFPDESEGVHGWWHPCRLLAIKESDEGLVHWMIICVLYTVHRRWRPKSVLARRILQESPYSKRGDAFWFKFFRLAGCAQTVASQQLDSVQ